MTKQSIDTFIIQDMSMALQILFFLKKEAPFLFEKIEKENLNYLCDRYFNDTLQFLKK